MAAIKERGALRVAAIGEFPWLPENTTGSGGVDRLYRRLAALGSS